MLRLRRESQKKEMACGVRACAQGLERVRGKTSSMRVRGKLGVISVFRQEWGCDIGGCSHFSPFDDDIYFGAAVIESGLASLGASESVSSSRSSDPSAVSLVSSLGCAICSWCPEGKEV